MSKDKEKDFPDAPADEDNAKTNTVQYFPEYRIYKPNKANNGSATRLQLKVKQERFRVVQFFWESAQQTGVDKDGNASFAWDVPAKKVTFKMKDGDVGEILAVLNGLKQGAGQVKDGKSAGIFHKNLNGNTIFKFVKLEKDGTFCYWVQISSQKNDGTKVEVKHSITIAEGEVLRILLQNVLTCMYPWR